MDEYFSYSSSSLSESRTVPYHILATPIFPVLYSIAQHLRRSSLLHRPFVEL